MSASLVGSEMCIRDRPSACRSTCCIVAPSCSRARTPADSLRGPEPLGGVRLLESLPSTAPPSR
eukprot:12411074-Alexandrium_andersonii.AAC.1